MLQRGHPIRANHHHQFASPLRNRLPLLTMAGHLHIEMINGHQWAEEVAVPKFVDPTEGGNEQPAEKWARRTNGSQYQGDCLMMGVDRRDRLKMTVRMQISENLSHANCPTMTGSQRPRDHHSSLALAGGVTKLEKKKDKRNSDVEEFESQAAWGCARRDMAVVREKFG